ncbi:chromosome segregation protein SMC [Adhaeribacter terreus]|uniref:Chromosome partition protein Smc n=1 Tax=Adhaeribacter terreus TaxID=529703 RepID=A0ABW0EBJ7_9BACT
MQVSKLEIKGFKSFGDKVTLNFNDGITGIVGPNGCGKSNIVDAIRWVLGEQKTRNLRSDKMENVIFNGSKNRKPVQMAEVSLTFDNDKGILPSEYSQVTVTRRYHRSGDSEYLLNGITCRLKDINDLFLDTGIGSDSYAIIELKMVDEILNDKENSRRTLFEEAAGISKFKVRKKQTLKKLEETDADLERVEDVLFEIGKNLKSLERQAKISDKYFKLKEDYKKYSLEYARRSMEQHQSTLERLEKELEKESTQKTDISELLNQTEDQLQQLKNQLDETQQNLSASQKSINDQTYRIRQLEADIKLKSERCGYLKERVLNLQQQLAQDKVNLTQTQSSIEQLEGEVEAVQENFLAAEEQTQSQRVHINEATTYKNTLQNQFQEVSARYKTKQQTVFNLNKDLEIAQVQIVNLQNEIEKLEQLSGSEEDVARQFEENLADLQFELSEKNAELEKFIADQEQIRTDINNLEIEIQTEKTELAELSRKTDSKNNQYKLTKSLVDNLEGFPDAIKFLVKSKDWDNPAPLLSDLILVQQEYKALIESYLEPYMNFFVVDTPEDALQAITLLNNQNKGRANFIILSEIADMEMEPTVSEGKLVAAYEVVSADLKYDELLRYMLNDVFISNEHDASFFSGDGRTYILNDGSIIKKPLSVSGGSVGLFDGNRIGRAQNLEKLAEELTELQQKTELQKSLVNTKQLVLQNLKAALAPQTVREMEKKVAEMQQELMGVRIRQEQYLLNRKNQLAQKDELQERLNDLRYKFQEMRPEAEAGKEELELLEENIGNLTDQINKQNEVIGQLNAVFNQENITYHQLKNRLSSLQQEIIYKQKNLENSTVRIQQQQEELERAQIEIENSEAFVEENSDALIGLMAEKDAAAKQQEEVEKQYFTLRGEIDLKEKQLREMQRNQQLGNDLMMQMQNTINETKLKLVAVLERLSAEFNLTPEDLQNSVEPLEIETEELSKNIQTVKQQLDNIGPVNPMAAEAYMEIEERNTFIRTQRQDLLNAKEILVKTIEEIDTVAKDKFMASFLEIKENFNRVFRSLFSEDDSCDLILVDPSNPTESKIEIMARPKGKRPLTINQLSGGEKTLTAISLLFAIYLLKPAPFCIFDEVDAPLDDANIDKFNNIIRKFSDSSQFIVVTHNKRTMASTDVMYGVTMKEPGVSSLIPVDLRQLA